MNLKRSRHNDTAGSRSSLEALQPIVMFGCENGKKDNGFKIMNLFVLIEKEEFHWDGLWYEVLFIGQFYQW